MMMIPNDDGTEFCTPAELLSVGSDESLWDPLRAWNVPEHYVDGNAWKRRANGLETTGNPPKNLLIVKSMSGSPTSILTGAQRVPEESPFPPPTQVPADG